MALTLSVLDQSPVRSGSTALAAIEETIKLAQAAEALGYARYWLAEHHGTEDLAGSSPRCCWLASARPPATSVFGSGGVMLSHYSPLKVAENFALLATMYPGRIDLGLGWAPGGDQLTAQAMLYGSNIGVEYYPAKVLDVKSFLYDGEPANKGLSRVKVTPTPAVPPEIWLLDRRQIAQLLRPRSVCRFRSRTSLTRPTRIALSNTIAEPLSRPIFLKRPKRAFVFSRFALRHRRKPIASPSAVRCSALCLRKEPSDCSPAPKRSKPTHIRTPKNALLKQASGAALSAIRLQ